MAKGVKNRRSDRLWCYVLVAFTFAAFYLLIYCQNFELDKPNFSETINIATKIFLVEKLETKKESTGGNKIIPKKDEDVKKVFKDIENKLEEDLHKCDYEEKLDENLGPMRLDSKDNVKPFAEVTDGKYTGPEDCPPVRTLAVLIPRQNNSMDTEHILIEQLHRILQAQRLQYGIYVIEAKANKPLTRGMLYNIGFVEALKEFSYHCVVIHDPVLVPEDSRLLYKCDARSPRYLVHAVRKPGHRQYHRQPFGEPSRCTRVLTLRSDQYRRAGGMSNKYPQPGDEGDNFAIRMRITLPPAVHEMSQFASLVKEDFCFGEPELTYHRVAEEVSQDGLDNLHYTLVNRSDHKLYQHLVADVTTKTDNLPRGSHNIPKRSQDSPKTFRNFLKLT